MRKGLGRHNRRSAGGPQPSLVLDFAGTGTLDPRITFTRSTTGTYYNSSGVLSTAAINEARFDYNPSTLAPLGLLIEQSSTNLLTYSQDFSNGVYGKIASSISTASNIAPDGTQTAQQLIPNTTNTQHFINFGTTTSGINTLSVYAKANGFNWIGLTVTGGAFNSFNLSTGTLGTVGSGCTNTITPVGNGWYKCTVTCAYVTSISYIFVENTTNQGSFAGDGTSGIYIWGAQLEALAFATSYIPTTSAQVTRASDNASMTGTNFSSWYNQGQGTVYNESDWISLSSSFPGAYSIDDGTTNNAIYCYGYDRINLNSKVGASNIFLSQSSLLTSTRTFIKNAIAYSNANYASSFAGASPITQASGAVPTGLTRLQIGAYNNAFLNGHIKKISYYPQALTSAQLQALTGS